MTVAPVAEPSVREFPASTGFSSILVDLGMKEDAGWPDHFGSAVAEWLSESGHVRPRTLSLFSGGGGLDIAFHDCGFEIVEAVELEDRYVATLQANAGEGGYLEGMSARCIDIADYLPPPGLCPDFIIGGPPCQTFSAAGRRANGVTGISDPRGRLFSEYVRLLGALQPVGFLFENVYGITGAQGGEAWEAILSSFSELGYQVQHRVLDSADYGVPQHRERLFIIGLREQPFRFPRPTHGPDSPGGHPTYVAGHAVAGADASGTSPVGGRYGPLLSEIPPGLNYSFFTAKLGHPAPVFAWRSKFSDFLYKADPEMPARTVKAQGGQYTGPFSWEDRTFSIGELKRLQTIPDAYEIVGGRQVAIEQIGNSVPPQLGRLLALSILQQAFGATLPFEMKYLRPDEKLGFRARKRALTTHYAAKAREALRDRKETKGVAVQHQQLHRWLSNEFGWSEQAQRAGADLCIGVTPLDQRWLIEVKRRGASDTPSRNAQRGFAIELRAADDRGWSLPVETIELCGEELRDALFTGAWKALEEVVRDATGVADLVQLSGYYQYEPQLAATMHVAELSVDSEFWALLSSVVAGTAVGETARPSELCEQWLGSRSAASRMLGHLRRLKRLGYEVRNHRTNPQIPAGFYLIPYAFPTLTPLSVQLHKRLSTRRRSEA